VGVLAIRIDDNTVDPGALVFMPVPGPVLGDEDVVLILGRELVSGVERRGSDPGYTRNVESLGWRGSGHFRCNP